MDRKTNLRDMDAPGVASGEFAGDSILKGQAVYPSSAEKGSNTQEEYLPEAPPVGGASGENKNK